MSENLPLPRPDAEQRPNVVLIAMDDLAYGDLACHGNPYCQTPHLDTMHRHGVRCSRSASGLVCTPARASLMTGRHAYRTRAIDTYCGRTTLDPDEVTLPQILRAAGYRTCISGKWHLGDNYPSRPMDLGFEKQLMHHGGGLRQPGNPGHWHNRDGYFNPLLNHNGHLVERPGYCTDIFTDHALEFIEQCRSEPFFVYLATNAPHTPLEIGDEWAQKYRDLGLPENVARIYGMVENIDHNVGRVFEKLEQLGLQHDTLVIYTSDHGPCGSARDEHGNNRFNAGLRAQKGTVYEGGTKVPYFWHWPRRFGTTGRDMDRLMGPIDVMPTLAAACAAKIPVDRTIDGLDLMPLLSGEMPAEQWPDRYYCLQWHRGDEPRPHTNACVQNQRYKLCHGQELYDLVNDPGEQHDIADQNPQRVAELRTAYERWFHDVSHTRPDNYAPPPIVLGTPHESPTILNRNDRRSHGPDVWKQDEGAGHWVVRFAKPDGQPYRVRVEVPPADQPGNVHLAFGDIAATQSIPAHTEDVIFDSLHPAQGQGTVEAWLITQDGQNLPSRYVHVE